jgi:hypothetical protein
VIVVACSATAGPRESDSVPLPNLEENPQAKSGLPRPCSAIPRWFIRLARARLIGGEYAGTVGGATLKRILAAYLGRLKQV